MAKFKVGDVLRSTGNTCFEWRVEEVKNDTPRVLYSLQPVAFLDYSIKAWVGYQATGPHWSTGEGCFLAPLDRQKTKYKRNLPAWW